MNYSTYPLSIATSTGGAGNATTVPQETNWDDFQLIIKSPEVGAFKDGSYFTPLQFVDNHRNKENAAGQAASLVVLDGDSRIDTETGEMPVGAPAPQLVHEVLTRLGITHAIYSSHSNQMTDDKGEYKGDRYRVVMPCKWTGADELEATVGWLIKQLHDAGVMLNPVSENIDVARLWYLPRVMDQAHADLFVYLEHNSQQPFPLDQVSAWWESTKEERVTSRKRTSAAAGQLPSGGNALHDPKSPIGKFNVEKGLNFISKTLVDLGYQYMGLGGTANGEPTYRFLNPQSQSGQPGTVIFKSDAGSSQDQSNGGVWRVYSHNGSDDWLEKYAHDAFSVYTLFSYNRDQRAALESIGVNVVYTADELQGYIDAASEGDRGARGLIIKRIAGSSLSGTDEEDLVQSIKKKFKMNLKPIRDEIKKLKSESAESASEDDAVVVGKELMGQCLDLYGRNNVIFSEDSLWLWEEKGVWSKYSKEYVNKILIHDTIQQLHPEWSYENRHVADVRNLVQDATSISGNMQPMISHHFINTLDCELHWSVERGVWETFPYDRKNRSTNQCQFKATASASCSRWDRFMLEIFANTGTNEDIAEQIQLLQACIGYTMTTSTKLERFIYMWGPGGNGKSVVMDLLSKLLGAENRAAVQPDQFDNKFQLGHMDKKLANLVTEVQEGQLMPAAKVKAIASGEPCTVEHKNGHPFEAHLYATLWFAANHLASSRDRSDAFYGRAIVIYLPNCFRDTPQQELDLIEQLDAEKDGIALRCLRSYGEVLKKGAAGGRGMELPKVIKRNVEEWQHEANPVRHFIEDCVTMAPEAQIPHGALFSIYTRWANTNGVTHRMKSRTFVKEVCRILNLKKGQGTGNQAVVFGIQAGQTFS